MRLLLFLLLTLLISSRSQAFAGDLGTRVDVDDKEVLLPQPVRLVAGDLLVPVEPVCQGLGDKITIDPVKNQIEIIRVQDGSVVDYDTTTGYTTVNGMPINTVKSMVPIMCVPGQVYLSLDIMAFLLGVSVQPSAERIDFNKQNIESAQVIKPTVSWKDMGVDYLDYGLTSDTVKLNPSMSAGPTQKLSGGR